MPQLHLAYQSYKSLTKHSQSQGTFNLPQQGIDLPNPTVGGLPSTIKDASSLRQRTNSCASTAWRDSSPEARAKPLARRVLYRPCRRRAPHAARPGTVCTTPLATTHWRFALLNTDSHFTSEGTNARRLWRQWIVRSARDCNSSNNKPSAPSPSIDRNKKTNSSSVGSYRTVILATLTQVFPVQVTTNKSISKNVSFRFSEPRDPSSLECCPNSANPGEQTGAGALFSFGGVVEEFLQM